MSDDEDAGPGPAAWSQGGSLKDPRKPGNAFSLPHGTQIIIENLEQSVLDELRDAQKRKRLKGEVSHKREVRPTGLECWVGIGIVITQRNPPVWLSQGWHWCMRIRFSTPRRSPRRTART